MIKLKTIYARIVLLLALSASIFMLLFTFLYFYTLEQEKRVYDAAQMQFHNEVASLLDLNSESMQLAASDFTRSDELVEFTSNRSTRWYNEHIVGAINSFKVDYICVYDTAFNIISEASSLKILSRRFIPQKAVIAMEKQEFSNFFLVTTEGLIEVSAASIHPTSDRFRNETNPKGSAFLVRLWDQSFKTKLSKITSSEVNFLQLSEPQKADDHNTVSVSKNLTDWNNKTISYIVFSRAFNLNFKTSKNLLLITVISFLLGMTIYSFIARLWISRPLNLITQILESENADAIQKLQLTPGEFRYIGILFEDYFNQRKNLENAKRKAEESDNLKSSFLANIAHEIRTPMHGILGFADLLKKSSLAPEQMQQYISIIENSSVRMLNTITDLIDISKIESGQAELDLSLVNINGLLDSMYAIFKPEAAKKGLGLTLVNSPEIDELQVKTDREKLEIIFSQLLKNAIKYTPNGSIEFGITHKAGQLEFFIKDTGIGIETDKHQSVFDRFTQADNSLSKTYEGAGLGLSITKAYVEMLNGTIWVESELGNGSVFYFTIPYKTAI